MTEQRQLYLEPTYIFGCLRDGAKYTKKGRGSLQPLLISTLQVLDDRVLTDRFLPGDKELTTDLDITDFPRQRATLVYFKSNNIDNKL